MAENLGPAMSSPDPTVVATPAKRTPRKAAPRGKWSEQQLLTSEKSVLIDSDLVVSSYFLEILFVASDHKLNVLFLI